MLGCRGCSSQESALGNQPPVPSFASAPNPASVPRPVLLTIGIPLQNSTPSAPIDRIAQHACLQLGLAIIISCLVPSIAASQGRKRGESESKSEHQSTSENTESEGEEKKVAEAKPKQVKIGGIEWYVDYDAAQKIAKEQNKPLWLHFGENPG